MSRYAVTLFAAKSSIGWSEGQTETKTTFSKLNDAMYAAKKIVAAAKLHLDSPWAVTVTTSRNGHSLFVKRFSSGRAERDMLSVNPGQDPEE